MQLVYQHLYSEFIELIWPFLQIIYKNKIFVRAVQQLILLTSCSWSCVKEGNLDSKDNNSVCRLHLMESSDTSDNNLMYRSTPCRGEKRYLLRLRFRSQLTKMICSEKNSHRIRTSTTSPSLMCRWTSFFVISIFLSLSLSKKIIIQELELCI